MKIPGEEMSGIGRVVEFIEGGKEGCLWEIVSVSVCGNCEPSGDECEECSAQEVISTIEEQVAKSGLDHMNGLAREWAKGNQR